MKSEKLSEVKNEAETEAESGREVVTGKEVAMLKERATEITDDDRVREVAAEAGPADVILDDREVVLEDAELSGRL